jgi:hypothetical protein
MVDLEARLRLNKEVIEIDAVNYKGLYTVNNFGDIKSLGRIVYDTIGRTRHIKSKIMSQSATSKKNENDKGYLCVRLTNLNGISKAELVHILVAKAFIPNPDNKPTVNHKDGNKHNNNVNNLEWNTFGENNQHAYDNNLKTDNRQVAKIDINTKVIIDIYNSIHEASRENDVSVCKIHSVCNNKRKEAGSFYWSYIYKAQINKAKK